QPVGLHASQQLVRLPTQAAPPSGARQRPALLRTLQLVLPALLVRQQVTAPGLPHVECTAQRVTLLRQRGGRLPAVTAESAILFADLTYSRCLVALAQSHRWSAVARVAATAHISPRLSPHRVASSPPAQLGTEKPRHTVAPPPPFGPAPNWRMNAAKS